MHLRAENLSKRYRLTGVKALDGVSWEIEPGQIIAVLGANGAGKTTLLSALAGNLVLDEGQVFMDGELFTPDRDDLRRRFAYLPAVPPFPPLWTPLHLIGTLLKLYQVPGEQIHARVAELLEKLDLLSVARWRFFQLSRGQACKAVLAGLIAADPEFWFVDEPFASGMDPRGLNCFKEYARKAVARGRTIVFTAQSTEVVESFAHRVCILEHGKIKLVGDVERLRELEGYADFVADLPEQVKQ